MPPDGNLEGGAIKNDWGYVSSQSYLIGAFDNSTSARTNQDVGLEGLSNDRERTFFAETPESFLNTVNPLARAVVEGDPSADNFTHWLNSVYDEANAKILERYKHMNGQDAISIITGTMPLRSPVARFQTMGPHADNT